MNDLLDGTQKSMMPNLKWSESIPSTKRVLRVADKILNVVSATVDMEGNECSLIDVSTHSYDQQRDGYIPRTLCDINWVMTYRDNSESPILNHGNTYRFRSLSNSPIMTVWRNRHRWDASEHIVATREDLVRFLASEGFDKPWLIFKQISIFPAVARFPDALVHRAWDDSKPISTVINRLYTNNGVTDEEMRAAMMAAEFISRKYRYCDLNIQRGSFHRDNLAKIAPFINKIFFHYGLVLVRKSDREARGAENAYQGTHGEAYHDLKLVVDRLAIYSNGEFESGWQSWLNDGEHARIIPWGRNEC